MVDELPEGVKNPAGALASRDPLVCFDSHLAAPGTG
jgi:hypothetical protein